MKLKTYNYRFREERLICVEHSEAIAFYCIKDKQKLCLECLESHEHIGMEVIPIQELKRNFIEEIRELEEMIQSYQDFNLFDFSDSQTKNKSKDEKLSCSYEEIKNRDENFSDNFINTIRKVTNEIFEDNLHENAKIYISDLKSFIEKAISGRVVLSMEKVVDFLSKKLKLKIGNMFIEKLEKCNILQNSFVISSMDFFADFEKLIKQYFFSKNFQNQIEEIPPPSSELKKKSE